MKKVGVLLLGGVLAIGLVGCGGNGSTAPSNATMSLVYDGEVSFGGGGDSSTIFFDGRNGKLVRITLTSAAAIQPYGYVEPPGGTASYTPPLETAKSGSNTGEITLTGTSGQVSYTVFDGNNVGGSVLVQIWIEQ